MNYIGGYVEIMENLYDGELEIFLVLALRSCATTLGQLITL